jgi:hypothetical protein
MIEKEEDMKRTIWMMLLVLGLLISLSGCIVSASPDTTKTVAVKLGETAEFKIIAFPETSFSWKLDGVVQPETLGSYIYKPVSADLGEHTLVVVISGGGSRTWKINVEQEASLTWEWVSGSSGADRVLSAQQTADGGYIAAGTYSQPLADGIYSADRCYVVKLDRSGSKEWAKLYCESSDWDTHANWIQQTSDGGYVIAGDKRNNEGKAWLIMKIDYAGKMEWQSIWGNEDMYPEGSGAMSIQQTADGGYIAAGYSAAEDIPGVINHGFIDVYVVKLNASGNLEWQKMFGGSDSDFACDIRQTTDGGYVVAGFSDSLDIAGVTGQGNNYIIKLDGTGSVEWQRLLPPDNYSGSRGLSSIRQTIDGGYIVAGPRSKPSIDPYSQEYYTFVIKLDESGIEIWRKSFDLGNADSIHQTSDGGYIIAGQLYSYDWRYCNGYLLKLNSKGDKEWEQYYGGEKQKLKLFDVVQTDDGGYVAAGSLDTGIWSGYWVWAIFPQGWVWVDTYLGNHEDFYVLKVGPDGEMN